MSLTRNLDQPVATALMLWCQQNTIIINQIPAEMIFDYFRVDVPVSSDMWLEIYPMNYDESVPLYHYGWLKLCFNFTTKWVRENKTSQALNIESIIVSQIKQSEDADLIVFMNQYIGGLQNIGLISKGNYAKLYTPKTTTSQIEIEFKYRINWLLYQSWLETYACDISSPNISIYIPLDNLEYNQITPIPA